MFLTTYSMSNHLPSTSKKGPPIINLLTDNQHGVVGEAIYSLLRSDSTMEKLQADIPAIINLTAEDFVNAIMAVCNTSIGQALSKRPLLCEIGKLLNIESSVVADILFRTDVYGTIKMFKEICPEDNNNSQLYFRNGTNTRDPSKKATEHISDYDIDRFDVLATIQNLSDGFLD